MTDQHQSANWRPIQTAPRGRYVLLWDGERPYVARQMTAVEDGTRAWVYARRLGADGIAFVVPEPSHWMPLPDPPGAIPSDDLPLQVPHRAALALKLALVEFYGRAPADEMLAQWWLDMWEAENDGR